MSKIFNVNDFKTSALESSGFRYRNRINFLKSNGYYTDSIERAVTGAVENINEHKTRSFVIYGEPQSGKTEMMIALTAKLLDEDHNMVILLLNDSVQLLEQNLERFLRAGLDPAPKKFSEILDPSITISNSNWIIFSKKNSADLQKLIAKVGNVKNKVIIDDEADFATPNPKINKNEKTKINELVGNLLSNDGIYIGVTATPARLDLNNTFENNNEKWIDFLPHPAYTGQDIFFPTTNERLSVDFNLNLLPEVGDDPKYLRDALFGFLVNVAFLNLNNMGANYCMLVHTSGKKADHTKDYQQLIKIFNVLKDDENKNYGSYVEKIYSIAFARYPGQESDITRYILLHKEQKDIVVMNSDTDKNTVDYRRATEPATLFTIAIGGNIVSRGVTFINLLCMFFTRDVKHKIQQDTYIQRARMFGNRGKYLKYFELHIPEQLYFDWQKCFVFHKLALSFIRAGKGSPLWLEDKRVSAVSSSSIDKARVVLDSGEMSWDIFMYDNSLDDIIESNHYTSFEKLGEIARIVGENGLPSHVIAFVKNFSPNNGASLAVHKTTEIGDGYASANVELVQRSRGFMSSSDLEPAEYPMAIHHFKIFKNKRGNARVFYKYVAEGKIRFIKKMNNGALYDL